MTGIERLRELAGGIERNATLYCITTYTFDAKHEDMAHKPAKQILADIADQIEREQDAMVADSPYDALPPDEREAVAWVRERGGLGHVKDIIHDFRAVVERLGIEWSESELHNVMDVLDKRLLPEGMEWPRYEGGEPVRIGDEVTVIVHDEDGDFDRTLEIRSIKYKQDGVLLEGTKNEMVMISHDERVRRPAKVLDADGAEIRVGDTVWAIDDGIRYEVRKSKVSEDGRILVRPDYSPYDEHIDPALLTHRAPVLAADGRPLREGETVWDKDTGDRFEVDGFSEDGFVVCWDLDKCEADIEIKPSQLTHERPVVDTWERLEEDVANASCPDVHCANHHIDASDASYEWAMARDIVRRAKALAGRDA